MRELVRACVCVRERGRVCVCVLERERVCVCVRLDEIKRVRERKELE